MSTPPNIVIPPKKPKLTKAERRALQEKQRLAKGQSGTGEQTKKQQKQPHQKQQQDQSKKQQQDQSKKQQQHDQSSKKKEHFVNEKIEEEKKEQGIFSHLTPYQDRSIEPHLSGVTLCGGTDTKYKLHPAVLRLGIQYSNGTIRGANARCRSMMECFKEVIESYTPNPNATDIRHDLDHTVIRPSFQHWTTKCRPHSITMGNAFTFLKLTIQHLDRDIGLSEAKQTLIDFIDAYIQERITFADVIIAKHACTKIVDDDVVLVYGYSETLDAVLSHAVKTGKKKFRVVLVDSRPLYEGRPFLNKLLECGIHCTYVLLNALSYVMMKEVTKVFLGAAALMSDGSVLSRIGTAGVALLAKSHNVPVLFCCETYKISHRVQVESITGNELGDPTRVARTHDGMVTDADDEFDDDPDVILADWRQRQNLELVNLSYDLTPSEFVSGIVTEMGILPPTSVAVLLREMNVHDSTYA